MSTYGGALGAPGSTIPVAPAAIPGEHTVENEITEAHGRARPRFTCPQHALEVR